MLINRSSGQSVLFTLTACLALSAPSHAGQKGSAPRFNDVRAKTALDIPSTFDADATTSLPGIVVAPGVRLLSEGVIATGYDSNIDHLVSGADRGTLGFVDAGLGLIAGPAASQTTAVLRGSFGYHDIDVRPDRWDAGVLLEHFQTIATGTSLNFGGFFLHDDIDTDANERGAGYYELSYKGTETEAFWRGRYMRTHYLVAPGSPDLVNRLFSRDGTFDHNRIEQSGGVLFLKDQYLAPYFEVGYANLDYTRELNPVLFSRDGDEIWTIGGVRVTLSDRLHVDLGARYNQRWLDDPVIKSHDTVFFDGKLVWRPYDGLYLEANIDRVFLEPITDESLLTESTTVSLLTIADLDHMTRLKIELGHITEDQVRAPDKFQHIYGEARLTHALDRHQELFASILGYHSRNEATDLEANRINVMIGFRVLN